MDPLDTDIFRERVEFLRKSQWWSRETLRKYQLDQFKKLIVYVYQNVPYYQKLFGTLGLSPDDFRSLQDIARMPLLTKSVIQADYDDFIPQGIDKNSLYNRSTGGSTGTPLTVYMDLLHLSRDKANTEYYMEVAGYNIFDFKSVRLYGDKIPQNILDSGQYWYVVENRKLVMSCYHITDKTVPDFVRQLNNFRPVYIHSRPSAIFPLCKEIVKLGLKLDFNLGAVFLDGEILLESQRELLEKTFNCRVYLIYGHTEGCVAGISCTYSHYLHFMPQIGILELLRPDGTCVTEEGEKGEMVVTGFNNYMFPLIRYRTFDIGINTNHQCPCNRQYDLLERVEGRVQDYAIARSGEVVPVVPALFNYNDMDWKGIHQFQALQKKKGELILRIVREPDALESPGVMKERVVKNIGSILGGLFELSLEYIDEIPRTRIGKFRYFEQKLDTSEYQVV